MNFRVYALSGIWDCLSFRYTNNKVRFINTGKWLVKYSKWSILEFRGSYFIDINSRDVNDSELYTWIRGAAWPRVDHEIQIVAQAKYYWSRCVLSAIIINRWSRETTFPILRELHDNYNK